jgi:hypothetical protein
MTGVDRQLQGHPRDLDGVAVVLPLSSCRPLRFVQRLCRFAPKDANGFGCCDADAGTT